VSEILHLGRERLEIFGEETSILQFRELSSAIQFLRGIGNDPARLALLRNAAAEHIHDVHRLPNEQLFRQLAALLLNGRIRLLQSILIHAGQLEDTSQPAQSETAASTTSQRKSSWIEINLRDGEGQAVSGARYQIKFPDGSEKQGNLDGFGHAEFYGINPGMCQVGFPELEDEDWVRA
jgi:hypothetical protein